MQLMTSLVTTLPMQTEPEHQLAGQDHRTCCVAMMDTALHTGCRRDRAGITTGQPQLADDFSQWGFGHWVRVVGGMRGNL